MQKKTINKIIILVLLVVLVAGIAVTIVKGLKFDLMYEKANSVDLYISKEFELKDIKQIAKEVLGDQEIRIQKIEIYDDAVTIIANKISEEQKQELFNKITEEYGVEVTAEDTEILTLPHVRGRDFIKPYIVPFIVTSSIVVLYFAIRYFKLGVIKVILKSAITIALAQAELLSVIALARIPVGSITIPLVLAVYVISIIGITLKFEKDLKEIKLQEEENED